MLKQTCLHALHEASGAKLVDFGGWSMPLHYGSQLEEHHAVRRAAGLFDVSHMTVVDVDGHAGQPRQFLQRLLANDIDKAQVPGQAIYSCMLNVHGGVIDDLIAYWLGGDRYRLVVNAATRDKDLAWLDEVANDFSVTLSEQTALAMIAVQGPQARALAAPLLDAALRQAALDLAPFCAAFDDQWFVARTGYTGEDGWEILLPEAAAAPFWEQAAEAGIRACGLGARDTLRLEAGLNLYGADMDETTSPYASNLGWTIALDHGRDFIGADVLRQAPNPKSQKLVGLLLEGKGVLRDHQLVVDGDGQTVGEITSGGFSPTLQRSIALARVNDNLAERAAVMVRDRALPVRIVRPPFVRHGAARIEI